jgi:hypothetical protein
VVRAFLSTGVSLKPAPTALSQFIHDSEIQLFTGRDFYGMSFLNKFKKEFEGLNLGDRLAQQQAGKLWYICFVSLLT